MRGILPTSMQKLLKFTVFGVAVLTFITVSVYDSNAFNHFRFDCGARAGGRSSDLSEEFVDDHDSACTPRTSVHFLKTHKCASSTIQNIMMRYGERKRLNFVLGDVGNYLGSPTPFKRRMIGYNLWPRSGRFDIFTHHTRLNIEEVQQTLQPGAAFVTILRDPLRQFESMWNYIGLGAPKYYNMSLTDFSKLSLTEKRALGRISRGRFGGNQMAYDLGYDPAIAGDPALTRKMIEELDKALDLVMISELMDESLILLKRLMCWSTDDVVYVTKNARPDQFRTVIPEKYRAGLEEYLALDLALYRHFNEKMVKKIDELPVDRFIAETEALVTRRHFLKQRCIREEVNGNKPGGQRQESKVKIVAYEIYDGADWVCSRLAMAELAYTDLLRNQQRERVSVWIRVYDALGIDNPAINATVRHIRNERFEVY